jgi:NADH oxidase (H2O2-forming)
MGTKEFDVLIIGGGPAMRNCNKMCRIMNPDAVIGLIREDKSMINHCAMPYVLDRSTTLEKVIIPDKFLTQFDSELFIDKAKRVDTKEKIVTCLNDRFKYKKLFLLTGANPVKPSIPGVELKNIFTLRKTESIAELDRVLDLPQTKNVVIAGGGYIGVEFGYLIKKRRGLNITVIELLDHILEASLDDEFCKLAEEELKRNEVNCYTKSKIAAFTGEDSVEAVILDSGKEIPADVVILAVGVKPAIDLALEAGIKADKGGIEVDKYMKTSEQDVYAAGDVINTVSAITGDHFPGRLGGNAVIQAKVAAINALGGNRIYPGVVNPSATKVFDISFGTAGLTERYLKDRGISYLVGNGETTSIYSMIPGSKPVKSKLIFKEDDLKLLGAQAVGDINLAGHVDEIAQAILKNFTLYDVLSFHYSTHPELSPQPRANVWVSAAEDLWKRLNR